MYRTFISTCLIIQTLTILCEGWSGYPIHKINNVEKMEIKNDPISEFMMMLKGQPVVSIKRTKEQEINNFDLSPFLLRGESISSRLRQNIVPTSCGGDNQTINVSSITINPWPVFLPGQLTIGFDVTFREDIPQDADLTGDLELEWQAGSNWVKIPCIGDIGSCSYGDLCGLSRTIPACPQEFLDNNVPCMCPFNKGRYTLPQLTVDIDGTVFLSGNYRATVKLNEANMGQVACYVLKFAIG